MEGTDNGCPISYRTSERRKSICVGSLSFGLRNRMEGELDQNNRVDLIKILSENKIQVKNKTMRKSSPAQTSTSRRKSYSQIMESGTKTLQLKK